MLLVTGRCDEDPDRAPAVPLRTVQQHEPDLCHDHQPNTGNEGRDEQTEEDNSGEGLERWSCWNVGCQTFGNSSFLFWTRGFT